MRVRPQVRGQQARAREQDQHGDERLGRQDELRQREQAPDGEQVAAQDRDPERDGDDGRRQGQPADPPERPVADLAHSRRLSALTSAQSSSSSTRWNASSPITPRARRSDSVRRSSAWARRCTCQIAPAVRLGRLGASPPCSARPKARLVLPPEEADHLVAPDRPRRPPRERGAGGLGAREPHLAVDRAVVVGARASASAAAASSPERTSVPSTTQKAVKRMKSRCGKRAPAVGQRQRRGERHDAAHAAPADHHAPRPAQRVDRLSCRRQRATATVQRHHPDDPDDDRPSAQTAAAARRTRASVAPLSRARIGLSWRPIRMKASTFSTKTDDLPHRVARDAEPRGDQVGRAPRHAASRTRPS